MFCKKCGNNIKGGECHACDKLNKTSKNNNKYLIIGLIISLIIMHLYIMFFLQENLYLMTSFLGIANLFAELLGGIIGSIIIAFIPTGLLYAIIYRKNIKSHGKDFIVGWLIISIALTYFSTEGFRIQQNEKESYIEPHEDQSALFYEDGFYINFPEDPEVTNVETEALKVKAYAATDDISNYYVKFGKFNKDTAELFIKKPAAVNHYLSKVVSDITANQGGNGDILFQERMIFFDQYEGVSYKNKFYISEQEVYSRGILFVKKDGSTVQVSVNYPSEIDSEMEKVSQQFIASLKLK